MHVVASGLPGRCECGIMDERVGSTVTKRTRPYKGLQRQQ